MIGIRAGSIAVGGGAIATYTDQLCSIVNSTFVGNTQAYDGAALGGGAICAENAQLSEDTFMTVLHCSFKDNYDAANQGSAILSVDPTMVVEVGNSIFEDTQGVVLDVRNDASIVSLGGNVATDDTTTTYTQNPEAVVLLNQGDSDTVSYTHLTLPTT